MGKAVKAYIGNYIKSHDSGYLGGGEGVVIFCLLSWVLSKEMCSCGDNAWAVHLGSVQFSVYFSSLIFFKKLGMFLGLGTLSQGGGI